MNTKKNTAFSKNYSADSLLATISDIRRARGWRLYTADGGRILSLWSDYGRNLLGYTPRGLAERAKSAFDRGLSAPLPGPWNDRIARMTRRLYPEYPFVRLQGSVKRSNGVERARFLFDRYLQDRESEQAAEFTRAPQADPIHIILPIPAALSPGILAFTTEPLDGIENELVDGMRGACAIFALSLLALERTSGRLSARFEESWRRFDRCGIELFSRSGPWLTPKYPRAAHRDIFAFCATRGVVISPEYDFPSSVPGDFDDGELRCLQTAASIFL